MSLEGREDVKVYARRHAPTPGPLYSMLWQFAAKRQALYRRRLRGAPEPWTEDGILRGHRFTNAYRAADRVSQRMIRILDQSRNESPATVLYRVMVFKLFNRIDTWEAIVAACGLPIAGETDIAAVQEVLDKRKGRRPIYSAAYVMPAGCEGQPKHHWHLELVENMLKVQMGDRVAAAASRRGLQDIYGMLLEWPTLGPFLAFQLAVDLNYGLDSHSDEASFVVPGPGAVDGLSKCFKDLGVYSATDTIMWMTDHQDDGFRLAEVGFDDLWGRRLQPIDVQNLLCETSKYTRESNPEVAGSAGRTKIKQRFRAAGPLPEPFFPPKWGINAAASRWYRAGS